MLKSDFRVPQPELLEFPVQAMVDPLVVFESLISPQEQGFLLESADLSTHAGTRSLMGFSPLLTAEIHHQDVVLSADHPSGRQLKDFLCHHLKDFLDPEAECFRFPKAPRGVSDEARLKAPTPFDVLRKAMFGFKPQYHRVSSALWQFRELVPTTSLLAGFLFGYDLIDCVEHLSPPKSDDLGLPDGVMWLPEIALIFEHRTGLIRVLGQVFDGEERTRVEARVIALGQQIATMTFQGNPRLRHSLPNASEVVVDWDDEDFCQQVNLMKEHVVCGDVFQIVPSRTFSVPCDAPLDRYKALKALNPSPYMFFLRGKGFELFGASPETAIKVDMPQRLVTIRPIAGTVPRGRDAQGQLDLELDSRLQTELLRHHKEIAEHLMLIDLARNDVARISEARTRWTPEVMTIEKYAFVMHLVSTVCGTLRRDLDALHAYQAAMNMGTLVGAPKVKAAQLLRTLEPKKRGPYGGAVGYMTSEGSLDSAIVIRSAVVTQGMAYVRAGAGVVFDSDPLAEARETRQKAMAVLRVLTREGA